MVSLCRLWGPGSHLPSLKTDPSPASPQLSRAHTPLIQNHSPAAGTSHFKVQAVPLLQKHGSSSNSLDIPERRSHAKVVSSIPQNSVQSFYSLRPDFRPASELCLPATPFALQFRFYSTRSGSLLCSPQKGSKKRTLHPALSKGAGKILSSSVFHNEHIMSELKPDPSLLQD